VADLVTGDVAAKRQDPVVPNVTRDPVGVLLAAIRWAPSVTLCETEETFEAVGRPVVADFGFAIAGVIEAPPTASVRGVSLLTTEVLMGAVGLRSSVRTQLDVLTKSATLLSS
jgi:hypothetical protein